VKSDAANERLCMSDRPYLLYVYCGSYNDALSKSDYIASSAWMIAGCS